VRVSTKPLITEGNWPGQDLNQGLPNDTPALYPLRHELMLLIGRLFALLFLNCRGRQNFCSNFIAEKSRVSFFDKIVLGYALGDFSQTHRVALDPGKA
jgi:hypothetical protein